jgi:hypothetical protein
MNAVASCAACVPFNGKVVSIILTPATAVTPAVDTLKITIYVARNGNNTDDSVDVEFPAMAAYEAIELPVRPPLEVRASDRVGLITSSDADERADASTGNGHVGLVVRK